METSEGNKLIADFMGLLPNKWDGGRTYAKEIEVINGEEYAEEWFPLMYHKSWDALMPVVEKIERMRFSFRIESDEVLFCNITGGWKGLACITISKIDMVWKAVIAFILWYNQQESSKLSA